MTEIIIFHHHIPLGAPYTLAGWTNKLAMVHGKIKGSNMWEKNAVS